ncbi:hypothetical protein JMF89_01225 [Clostridiaceae bacterium UIB06]|uniref:Uncharacterized protein n=1 Tax=Clostridium thailandense TaxID=2794346 RepID=A0A949U443_9CLOT|nr:hypothetical protein [Clostridium thailandense]MBV7276059.1 hypothetical protein [Clostridium thailandense]MCH5135836.1 hypothetical protein [Clostridiaceae bacterium UIB06]
MMFKSKKDFNEITVWINLECNYEHPLETVENVQLLLYAVYKHFDSFVGCYFKKAIDVNILRTLANKMDKNIKYLRYNQILIKKYRR